MTPSELTAGTVRQLALDCGFELAGVTPAVPAPDRRRYHRWAEAGYAGQMQYLTDRRAALRDDPRRLLPSARSVISVGRLYNTPWPYSTQFDEAGRGWISRYAWGSDYHAGMRIGLERLERALRERVESAMEARILVDTAPFLERTYARLAGLGWIGKNTCLINQQRGSWFFLGELLVSLAIEPEAETPPPDRCGSCTRCIDACPTAALVPSETLVPSGTGYTLDSRLCISYFTIELRGPVPEPHRAGMGANLFGCDICQDVCPWNRRAPAGAEADDEPRCFAPPLDRMAALSEADFRRMFQGTPVTRARYSGFLRNVAIAMGNGKRPEYRPALERLAASPDALVAEHALWALQQLP